MNRKLLVALGLLLLLSGLTLGWWAGAGAPTTLLIVRHADREAGADALAPPGTARARALLHALENTGVAAIYHSDTARARETAAPLAAALRLTPRVYPAGDALAVVKAILAAHRGERVVVVGHSNTVPALIAAAGGPSLPHLDERVFDDLFVLSVGRRPSGARLLHLKYGAASPRAQQLPSSGALPPAIR